MKRKNLAIILGLILLFVGIGYIVPLTEPRIQPNCESNKTHFAILRGQKDDFEKLYSSYGELQRHDGLECSRDGRYFEAKLYLL